jgi:hypothetical protein
MTRLGADNLPFPLSIFAITALPAEEEPPETGQLN